MSPTKIVPIVFLALPACASSATTEEQASSSFDGATETGSMTGQSTGPASSGTSAPSTVANTTQIGATNSSVGTTEVSSTGAAPSLTSSGAESQESSSASNASSDTQSGSGSAEIGTDTGATASSEPTSADTSDDGTEPPATSGEGFACDREFTIPALQELATNAKLPDPFTFLDGTKVESKDDWVCRQKEISLLAQAFIYGPKPPPPESVEATFSDGTLNITVNDNGRSIDFSVDITTPNGDGPHPAVFNIGATIPNTGSIAYQAVGEQLAKSVGSQGRKAPSGLFYDLYPDSTDTGSLMVWAWGASRVIDALEKTEGHKVDPTKLTALGCSRNGKEAATIALFDNRIAMVATQSPGSGTTSSWRIAESQTSDVQTAGQIFGEDTWMGEPFGDFGNQVDKLPVDQHEVLALAWPRPLIVREGTNDSWNCPVCVHSTMKYTQMVFEALGSKDAVGFTHYNGGHCENGGNTWSSLQEAFVQKYLFGDSSVSTEGMFTDSFDFDAAKWQDGELPTLP